jgi:hypothetical protein
MSAPVLFVTKARYLGSLILPSPIEVEVTLSLYSDRIEIPELEATVYLDNIDKVTVIKGSELPVETTLMAGVVGLVIDKDKPHVIIQVRSKEDAQEGILLKLDQDTIANQLVKEVKSNRNSLTDAT